MAGTASARRVRASVLAAVSLALGLAGHQQAAGHSVTTGAVVLAAAYCALAGLAYSRRRLSGPALTAILLGNQVVVHVGLTLGAGPHAGHDTSGLVPGPWMILAHLVATVLTAAAIVTVEAAVVVCTALLSRIGRAVRLSPVPPAPRRVLSATAYRHALRAGRHPGSRPGRGPPLAAA